MAWDSYATAAAMRDLVNEMVEKRISEVLPRYRYGTVTSIDRATRIAMVLFAGETDDMPVRMGSVQPAEVGQVVRVAGLLGDRYLDDVMGPTILLGDSPTNLMQVYNGNQATSLGPTADGPLNPNVADLPNTYPRGKSIATLSAATGWPVTYGLITTEAWAGYTRVIQILQSTVAASPGTWRRIAPTTSTWGPWVKIGPLPDEESGTQTTTNWTSAAVTLSATVAVSLGSFTIPALTRGAILHLALQVNPTTSVAHFIALAPVYPSRVVNIGTWRHPGPANPNTYVSFSWLQVNPGVEQNISFTVQQSGGATTAGTARLLATVQV